jgi:predicted NBD/HSP70 family sugar kinase
MNREDYLRELDSAGRELKRSGANLVSAANPINQLRHGVAHEWKWWLPGASVAGFALARLLRRPARQAKAVGHDAAQTGAAFWIPLLVKLLPAALAQLAPLLLSLRSGRKP